MATQNLQWTDHSGDTYWTIDGDTLRGNASTGGLWTKASSRTHSYAGYGVWYFEVTVITSGTLAIGIAPESISDTRANGGSNNAGDGGRLQYMNDGRKRANGSYADYGAAYTTGDVVGFTVDLEAGTITAWLNGVSQGVMYSGLSSSTAWIPHICTYSNDVELQLASTLVHPQPYQHPWGNPDDHGNQVQITQLGTESIVPLEGEPEVRLSQLMAQAVSSADTVTPQARISQIMVEAVVSVAQIPPPDVAGQRRMINVTYHSA